MDNKAVLSPEPKNIITSDLHEELLNAGDIATFRKKYFDSFVDISLKEYLENIIESRSLKRADIVKASGLTETYTYQIFAGIKSNPSRDKLIALAVGMRLSLDECQKFLRLAGVNPLYAKNSRDSVIIFGINKALSVLQLNDMLFEMKEYTL